MQAAIGQPGGGGGALLLRNFKAIEILQASYREVSGF